MKKKVKNIETSEEYTNDIILLACHFQIGDVKGLLGLLMVTIQTLREKLKIFDVSYGTGTGNLCN